LETQEETMTRPRIATAREWRDARVALLEREKRLNKERDELAAARRALPWVKIEKPYAFKTAQGTVALGDLFDGRSQLIVYHFMFGPDWSEGCKSCSFWAEQYDAARVHLRQRDTNLVVVSRGPLAKLQAFKERMGWKFPWVSSEGTTFNRDFHVSFDEADLVDGKAEHNFALRETKAGAELPGLSVFAKNTAGAVFHTYSCYSRGLDPLNATYQMLDLTPKGRDEAGLPWPMAWLKLKDQYTA
jgi:predicted dithiol-disulfide oxidoreductase (DUF899 family)